MYVKLSTMRYAFLVFLCSYSMSIFSQNFDPEKVNKENNIFGAESMYMVLLDSNNVVKTEKPWGKNITILNDKFFKSYEIIYTNSEGALEYIFFDYLKGKESGSTYFIERESKQEYVFFDTVKDNQPTYIFARSEKIKGFTMFFAIKNVAPTKL